MEQDIAALQTQGTLPTNQKRIRKGNRRKGRTLFIVCILAIPILNWLVFWLYVNISSIFLAFQEIDPWTGTQQWSMGNFEKLSSFDDKNNDFDFHIWKYLETSLHTHKDYYELFLVTKGPIKYSIKQ